MANYTVVLLYRNQNFTSLVNLFLKHSQGLIILWAFGPHPATMQHVNIFCQVSQAKWRWIGVDGITNDMHLELYRDITGEAKLSMDLVGSSGQNFSSSSTVKWWRFAHEAMPIRDNLLQLGVQLDTLSHYINWNQKAKNMFSISA